MVVDALYQRPRNRRRGDLPSLEEADSSCVAGRDGTYRDVGDVTERGVDGLVAEREPGELRQLVLEGASCLVHGASFQGGRTTEPRTTSPAAYGDGAAGAQPAPRHLVRDRTTDRLSGQETVVDLAGHAVALARRALEALPVDDRDPTPGERDETGLLQDPGGHGHRCPPDPEHLGEEFVRHRELVGSHTIVGQQQPARATLLDGVEAVTGHLLRHLAEERERVTLDERRQGTLPVQLFAERGGFHADDVTGDLDGRDLAGVHHRASPRDRQADHTLVADRGDLDAGALVHAGEDRDDGVDGEMDLVDAVTRLTERLFLLHGAGLQLPLQAFVVLLGEGAQQPIRSFRFVARQDAASAAQVSSGGERRRLARGWSNVGRHPTRAARFST